MRPDWTFDTFGAARRRQDWGDFDGFAFPIDPGESVTQVYENTFAAEVPWGAGAQDYILEADIPGSEPVAVGTFDAFSTSERLRDIAAEVGRGATREEAITGTPGGSVYDPNIRTGTLDWSDVIRGVPNAVSALAGAVSTIGRTVGTLAGVRAGAPPGNPAPGGRPGPSFLQRVLGGAPSTMTQPAGGGGGVLQTGNLIVLGLAGGLGFLLLRKR